MNTETLLHEIYEEMGETSEIYQGQDSAPAIDWKPVMIGDVLEYHINDKHFRGVCLSSSGASEYSIKNLVFLWKIRNRSIAFQSQECIEYVHSLILKK